MFHRIKPLNLFFAGLNLFIVSASEPSARYNALELEFSTLILRALIASVIFAAAALLSFIALSADKISLEFCEIFSNFAVKL